MTDTVTAPRRSRRRTVLAVLGGLVVLLVALAAFVAIPGSYERYSVATLRTPAGARAAPAWTRACRNPLTKHAADACVRVTGRVIWVQGHDPDGDGDRHVIVASRLRVHIVKFRRQFNIPVPSIGQRITATGFDMTGASGRDEIDTDRLTTAGNTYVRVFGPGRLRRTVVR